MPFKSQLHIDQLLSNVSIKYGGGQFLAMKIFPEVAVTKDTDKYRIYQPNFRVPQTLRANRGKAREHYFEVSTSSYALEDHALKDYISEDDKDNYDIADLRVDTTENLTDTILRRLEKSVMDLFTTTNWSLNTSLAATGLWTLDTVQSNPLPVVDTALSSVLRNSGQRPNFGLISLGGFVGVKNHQSVTDRIKYTQTAVITEQLLATLFGVPEFYVSEAQIDTSDLGRTTTVQGFFTDACFFGYKPPRASPKAPSAGYVFRKNVPMVRRWFDDERKCEAIEVRMKYAVKVVASLSGYLINNIE